MAVCIVAPAPVSTWPPRRATPTPLRTTSATWNTKFPSALDLELPAPILYSAPTPKPRLRLPALAPTTAVCRFDPFADDDEPPQLRTSTPTPAPAPAPRENTPPLARGRCLTPLTISSSSSAAPQAQAPSPTGRRRAPSFSAGSPSVGGTRVSLAALSHSSTPSPAPYLSRPSTPTPPAPAPPHVPGAPSPFHARHYPTPDARARLLARTLLHRIHAVGRPRSPYACSSSLSRTGASASANGYESETGARAYVPSRLSESVVAAC